jgi:hypothetical protein
MLGWQKQYQSPQHWGFGRLRLSVSSGYSRCDNIEIPQTIQTMTLKEQLFQELDNAPDHILEQILNDLRRLTITQSDTPTPTNSLTSLLGQAQGTFANPEAVDRFIRQERDKWDS